MAPGKIAIIPARSGSKGLPNKNILRLLDKPLIAYTIEAACRAAIFERVIVTTDSLEYKFIAEKYGAEVIMRNEALSSDKASSFMVIEDVLSKVVGYNYFVLLQPTSPFRHEMHILQAIELFESSAKANFLVSVTESNKSADLIKPVDGSLSLKNFDLDFSCYRRQDHKEYTPNGAIFIGKSKEYLAKKHFFGHDSIAYIMNKRDSLDIDDQLDFEMAIFIQTLKNKKENLLQSVKKRILEKKDAFSKVCPVTLIGHSLFDYWDIAKIKGKDVNNLGIAGINSKEYYEFILDEKLLQDVGDTVLFFSGTNDIVLEGWDESYTITWSEKIIESLKSKNPNVHIYFLAVPPVTGRMERHNDVILRLNSALQQHFSQDDSVTWVPLSSSFYNDFGSLPDAFTYDGLHFTPFAYLQLENDISEILK
ncbi:3-deoxy-manno-octulosonate cytidylyltransferase [Paramixta manurensis]|uniref:3-deoxy-manno-octulosonate cytidylyltransferase n=1 Tax=Paramixta manurensis TaxID=2740817 RepID=A0A6M8UFT3_9GAMM|nr:3-deoxy-manno-octulosonate cytidylyltransferase [Erwiniaceae bacterium PD-1]